MSDERASAPRLPSHVAPAQSFADWDSFSRPVDAASDRYYVFRLGGTYYVLDSVMCHREVAESRVEHVARARCAHLNALDREHDRKHLACLSEALGP